MTAGGEYPEMDLDRELMIRDGLPPGAASQMAIQHARERAREADPGLRCATAAEIRADNLARGFGTEARERALPADAELRRWEADRTGEYEAGS